MSELERENSVQKICIENDEVCPIKHLVIGIGNRGVKIVDAMVSCINQIGFTAADTEMGPCINPEKIPHANIDFIAVDTDNDSLEKSCVKTKIQIGEKSAKESGTKDNMDADRKAAEESLEIFDRIPDDCYAMIFITVGMGGATGSRFAPIIASAVKEKGIITIGVVTKPFLNEGDECLKNADNGISELEKYVNTLIVIPNQKLIEDKYTTSLQAYKLADDILNKYIIDIICSMSCICSQTFIGLDFYDIECFMTTKGLANVGIGYGKGKDRIKIAAETACKSPFLEAPIEKAKAILANIMYGEKEVSLKEIEVIAKYILGDIAPDAEFMYSVNPYVFGNETLDDDVIVIVIAMDFKN